MVRGGEWVWLVPHNIGLRVMLAILGKPRSVYNGPYPSKEETLTLLSNVVPTRPDQFSRGEVLAGGKTNIVGRAKAEALLSDLADTDFEFDSELIQSTVGSAVYQGRCLVIRITTTDLMLKQDPNPFWRQRATTDGCMLFDLQSMRAFARYIYEGDLRRVSQLLTD